MFEKITSLITTAAIAFTGLFTVDVPYTPTPQVQKPQQETTLGSFNPAAGGTYRLKNSVGTTDTTINLSSFKEPVSNIPLTMTVLNTDIAYATIDPQSPTRKEFVSFTGITQNADGSATLTGVTRGLGFTYPFTASSTLRKEHPGQSIFILSDSPQFFAEYARVRSDESISGSWTVPTPTNASGIANKAYVDSIVAGGAVTLDGISVGATAGESVATGTILYLFTDGKWYKASASTAASSTRVQLGVAQGTASTNNTIPGGVLTQGYDETNRGGVAGQTIFLSNTAGATSTATGTVPVILGQMRSDSVFYFDPTYANTVSLFSSNTFTSSNTFNATTTFTGFVSGVASSSIITYTTAGTSTYTKPTNLRHIIVEAVGGGGGGGRCVDTTNDEYGAGGGGGGYAKRIITASELASSTTVVVGAGGIGQAAGGTAGTNGSTTSFGSFVTALGGSVASNMVAGSGGSASGGHINILGSSGIHTRSSTNIDFAGHGGDSFLGVGGAGLKTDGGNNGFQGGGGSGARCSSSNSAGYNGGAGIVVITEFY